MTLTYTPQTASTQRHIEEKYRIDVFVNRFPRRSNEQLSTACSARLAGMVENRGAVKEQKATSGSCSSLEDPSLH